MPTYEMMVVLDGQRSDEDIEAQLTKIEGLITGHGCEITKSDNWGKRRLAFKISGKVDGYYAVRWFTPGEQPMKPLVDELDRMARLEEIVLRHLVIKLPRTKKPIPLVTKPDPNKDARPDWGFARRGWRPPRPHGDRDRPRWGDRDRPPRRDSAPSAAPPPAASAESAAPQPAANAESAAPPAAPSAESAAPPPAQTVESAAPPPAASPESAAPPPAASPEVPAPAAPAETPKEA